MVVLHHKHTVLHSFRQYPQPLQTNTALHFSQNLLNGPKGDVQFWVTSKLQENHINWDTYKYKILFIVHFVNGYNELQLQWKSIYDEIFIMVPKITIS